MNHGLLGKKLLTVLAAAAMTTAFAQTASAQDPLPRNYVVEQFEPLPNQGTNILNIGTSSIIRSLEPSAGVMFHYEDTPYQLVYEHDTSHVHQRIIEHVLKGEVWASLGLFDSKHLGADLGVVMPIILNQKAGQPESAIAGLPEFGDIDSFTIADLRIVPKLRLVNSKNASGFGLAVIAPISVPTGDTDAYASEGYVRVEPRLVLDYTHEYFTVAVNVGYQHRSETQVLNFEKKGGIKYGLGLEVPLIEDLSLIGSYFGSAAVDSAPGSRTTPMEALGGLQYWFAEDWLVNAGAGAGLTSGVGSPKFHAFLSVGYTPRLRDVNEFCPDKPHDYEGPVDENDCPVNPYCPDKPKDYVGPVDQYDCPVNPFCPDKPKDYVGPVDNNDCPVNPHCPDKPKDYVGPVDENDCPYEEPEPIQPRAILTENKIEILERVYFDFDKATIQSRSYPLLDEVVRILVDNPQVNLIRIEGHTDSIGSRAYNNRLSNRRAKAILDYLVKNGVPTSRLVSRGYGFDFPIDTNATQEGRDRNRRVEFNILEIDGKPVKDQVIRTKK